MINLKQVLLLLTWYDYRIHRGVAQVAREAGWQLICPKGDIERQRTLRGWQGDGCIALIGEKEALEYFHNLRIPIVDLGLTPHNLPVTRLATDNYEVGRLAAAHFIDHGYREVFAASPQDIPMFQERLESLKTHMKAHGGRVSLLNASERDWAGILTEFNRVAGDRGKTLQELSIGFFAYEDYRAAELLSLCLQEGLRVPENVAILGVDNDDLVNAGLAIGLSSVDTDQEGLGREGANLLRQIMAKPQQINESRSIRRHPPKGIVTRESTDCYAVRSPLVARALHWIHNNYQNGIQAIDVASAMQVTQQGLQKAFSDHHLRSPAEEIRHQRVHAARHHLVHSSARLETIAEACGYHTVDTLIGSFRKAFGTTPGKFRQQQRLSSGHQAGF